MKIFPGIGTLGLLLVLSMLCAVPATSFAQVAIGISIRTAPPALPVYVQPPCPQEGYLWTPGYWAYADPAGYYWVPGVWVAPPQAGLLWTPGYWAFERGFYGWHRGYWGPHVGFYGGINYGFGYGGVGFFGGRWEGAAFRYNTAVVNVNTTVVRNVYVDRTVANNTTVVNRAAFNGEGGINARATADENRWGGERHFDPTSSQLTHEHNMQNNRDQFASNNHGAPGAVAMDRVDGRRYNQQGRIANGIGSGQLTAGETKNIEHREAGLNNEIHTDRAANGGRLTPQERRQVNGQQNNLSRSIYNDKHNDNTATYGNNEVGQRRANQQQRIANGVGSGQLSPGETARAEHTEQGINQEVHADRTANGGKLTGQERQQVNRQQNHASRQIYHEKHNGKTAPK